MKEAQAGEKCALFRPLVLSFVEEVVNFVAHDGAFRFSSPVSRRKVRGTGRKLRPKPAAEEKNENTAREDFLHTND